ncbi:MAG: AAA family ATPase [Myxococcota bacterium]|nr:AAA family ATPase [Myxococcota bacterium]
MIFAFGEFELDTGVYELRRAGEPQKLEPKAFDVLLHLVRQRERVVSKRELLDTLWADQIVTESALPRAVAAARKVLGDDRERQGLIRTVHGRGYQFVAAVQERAAATAALEAPGAEAFVGRDAVLARLEAGLDASAAGRGRVFLLFGEPGIGKTRTAEEVATRAAARGFEVLSGRCWEGAGAPAFWPWVQILRGAATDVAPERLAAELAGDADAVAHLLPELAAALPEPAAPLPTGADEARFRLFEGVTHWLRRRSARRPLLLCLDDLHWADEPSVLLLHFLARGIESSALVVLACYREVELRRGQPLGAVLGELSREAHTERVPLRGLDADSVAGFLAASTGATPDASLVDAAAEITQGNPFFLHETLRLLRAEGALGAQTRREDWEAALPQGLRDVIGRRLDRLSDDCNHVLSLAAVVGVEFGVRELERFAELPAQPLLELLDEAVRARVLVESREQPGRYAFAHALIRQSIYEELATPVRVQRHQQLARSLEALYGEASEAHLDELAHHFFQAAPLGAVDRAVDYAVRAGRAAQRLLAYEAAAAHFERALQALDLRDPDDETRRCELLLELGNAREQIGDRLRMREAYAAAAERARRVGRPDLLALAALGFAGRTERATPDTGMRALLEEALAALGDREDALRARLLGYLVGTPPIYDDPERRLALSARAVALARASGETGALMAALQARCFSMLGPDRIDERLATAEELVALARRQGDPLALLGGLEARARTCLLICDTERADLDIAEYCRVADALQQPSLHFLSAMWRVPRALTSGRFEEAEHWIEQAHELGRSIDHPATEPLYVGQRFWLSTMRGDTERIVESMDALMSVADWVTGSIERVMVRSTTAYALALAGRIDEAAREFELAMAHGLENLARDEHWLTVMAAHATTSLGVGALEHAARIHELLLPCAELNTLHELLRCDTGPVAYYLGELAAGLGRLDAALAHHEAALALSQRMAAPPHVARSQAACARVLLARGGRSDRARARDLLAAAGATAERLGLRQVLQQVAALRPAVP